MSSIVKRATRRSISSYENLSVVLQTTYETTYDVTIEELKGIKDLVELEGYLVCRANPPAPSLDPEERFLCVMDDDGEDLDVLIVLSLTNYTP